MELKNALFLAVAVVALLQFGLLQRLKSAWARLSFENQLKRFGIIAILEKLRDYALVAAVCFAAFLLFLLFLASHSADSATAIQHALSRVRSAQDSFKEFREYWKGWVFFLSFLLLWAAWYRSAKSYAKETLASLRRKEYERLAKLRDEGSEEWKDLPPTHQMDEVLADLQKVKHALEEKRTPELSPQEKNQLTEYAQKLSIVWTFLDFDRRIEIPWDTEPVAAASFWGQLGRFFSSRGFLADMKGLGKMLSHVSFGLLILSMVGFAATAASDVLHEQVAHLSDLEITTAAKESETQLRAAEIQLNQDTTPQKQQLSPLDHQHIKDLSRHLAREVRGDAQWPHTEAKLRYEAVKENIRKETILATATTQGPGDAAGEKETAPRSDDPLADKIEERITAEGDRNPSLLAKIRRWGSQRYSDPSGIDKLRDSFVEQITDVLFDVIPTPKTPLSDKAVGLITDPMKKSASELLATNVNRLLLNVIRDTPEEQTWKDLARDGSINAVLPSETLELIRKQYPSVSSQQEWATSLHEKRVGALSVEDAAINGHIEEAVHAMPTLTFSSGKGLLASRTADSLALSHQQELADLVSTYEAQFPLADAFYSRESLYSDIDSNRQTLKRDRYKVAQTEDSDPLEKREQRATDLEKLRNYSRVGGVLIGAPADQGKAHVSNIAWTHSGSGVSFTLTSINGAAIQLGPFDADMVNRALAYAVDGRLAAATVLNTALIERSQVMIHPALRDSLLGAQIGRADEWVFAFLDPDHGPSPNGLRKAMDALDAADALYDEALTAETGSTSNMKEAVFLRIRPMADGAAFQRLSESKEFDPQLLKIASRCLDASDNEKSFAGCITANSGNTAWKARIRNTPKPRTQIVSQIFEQRYILDDNLSFLRDPSATDGIWPLQFTVQMTINDKEHLTLAQFQDDEKPQSTRIVLSAINAGDDATLLQRLKDFTILQRVFRLALNGEFGNDFPVEKLVDLARETKKPRPSCRTPRWIHPVGRSHTDMEQDEADELGKMPPSSSYKIPLAADITSPIKEHIRSCEALLRTPASDVIPSEVISRSCKLFTDEEALNRYCASGQREACAFIDANVTLANVAAIHSIRERLGAVRAPATIAPQCLAEIPK